MAERFPQDFCGAAPRRIELIYLSSDGEEEMDNLSVTSVMDLQLTSDDEEYHDEIMMMAQCVEMELSAPIPVPGPLSSRLDCVNMQGSLAGNKTPDQKHSPPPVFDQSFFSLGRGNGPIRRDDRVRNNHPIKLCSKLTPLVDTPMSPPPEERGPASNLPSSQSVGSSPQQTLDTITNHFQGMELSGFGPLANYSDCVVCGKFTIQIQQEAVSDYLDKTAIPGETALQVEARRRAFIEGMQVGTFLLLPGGVSQAAACDGNLYTIDHSMPIALPGTIPI